LLGPRAKQLAQVFRYCTKITALNLRAAQLHIDVYAFVARAADKNLSLRGVVLFF